MWDHHRHTLHYHPGGDDCPASSAKQQEWELELSSISNVVMYCCSKILSTSLEDLQTEFLRKAQVFSRASEKSELTFLEYCCFKTLTILVENANFLKDKQFRYLSFEMMIAWEAPDSVAMCFKKEKLWQNGHQRMEDGVKNKHFFHPSLIPLLIHQKSTVGIDAFLHIAPAIPGVADVMSAHFLFNALACPNGGRLSFRVYDRYLKELDKALNKSREWRRFLHLEKSEVVVEVGGAVAGSSVIQHIGSSYPGRLILTSSNLCFEPIGLKSYDARERWDLASDQQQVVEPYSSGSRMDFFSKSALSFKSDDEHAIFEFSGIFGSTHRDYWLMIIQEILYAQEFARKFAHSIDGFKEAIFRSVMGILRFKAVRGTLRADPAKPKLLLFFSMVNVLPEGDSYLRALKDMSTKTIFDVRSPTRSPTRYTPKSKKKAEDMSLRIGEFFLEQIPRMKEIIETASPACTDRCSILLSRDKGDSLSINVATMKAVVSSLRPTILRIDSLLSWDEPYKTIAVILVGSGIIMRDLLQYVGCLLFLGIAIFVLFFKPAGDGPLCGIVDVPCPDQSNAGEVLELQQVLHRLEELFRTSNIVLLKMRALIFSVCPKATDQAILFLMIMAAIFTIFPAKIVVLLLYMELFTRKLPLRQENFECYLSSCKLWWSRIPMPPIFFKELQEY